MHRVSYQDRVSNDRIFEMVHEKPKLLLTVRERKLKYSGHLIGGNEKKRVLLKERYEETKRRGRLKNTCGRDILK